MTKFQKAEIVGDRIIYNNLFDTIAPVDIGTSVCDPRDFLSLLALQQAESPVRYNRRGLADAFISGYNPVIVPNVSFALDFTQVTEASEDILIYKIPNTKRWRVGCDGKYRINVEWTAELGASAPLYAVSRLQLEFHKNGTSHKRLDQKPMKSMYGVGNNYYFPFMSLQGSTEEPLTVSDYFEIRLTHDGALPLDASAIHNGSLNIAFSRGI